MFFLPLASEWLILVFSVVILRIQLMCKLSSTSLQLVRKICFSIKRVQSYWVKRWLLLNPLLRILIRFLLFYQISLIDNMKAPDQTRKQITLQAEYTIVVHKRKQIFEIWKTVCQNSVCYSIQNWTEESKYTNSGFIYER